MEKLFTDIDYANKAVEANEQGKFLYIYIHEVQYETEVLEWVYVQKEEKIIDPITGEERTIIVDVPYPKMVEETYTDPETGEEVTMLVQAHHTETTTKEVQELLIDDEFKYVIFNGNYTNCEDNPNYDDEIKNKRRKEIIKQLDELDLKSIRAIRANDSEYIQRYEQEAEELRQELKEL